MKKYIIHLVALLIVALITSSCCGGMAQRRVWIPTRQKLPSELEVGMKPNQVICKMGKPNRIEKRPGNREVWTYWDLWWSDNSWGSWELHFNNSGGLSGWKLIDPPSNEEFNRSAFFGGRW